LTNSSGLKSDSLSSVKLPCQPETQSVNIEPKPHATTPINHTQPQAASLVDLSYRGERCDAVLIAAAVIVADLPRHLSGAAALVLRRRVPGERAEDLRPEVAVLRELCLGVVAGLGAVRAGRGAAGDAAGVTDGRGAL